MKTCSTIVYLYIANAFERRRCKKCGVAKSSDYFTKGESIHSISEGRQGHCKDCIAKHQELKDCSSCQERLPYTNYSSWMWKCGPEKRKCLNCMERHQELKDCSSCQERLPYTKYGSRMWRCGPEERKCLKCARHQIGTWRCIKCKLCKQKAEFSAWLATQKRGHCDQTDRRGSNRN